MTLLEKLAFRIRCLHRERLRKQLAHRAGDNKLLKAQGTAWPDRGRLRRPWEGERFVVFDTETTGLDPQRDQPVSLGAASVVEGRIAVGDTFHRVIASETSSSRDSIVVHGLTPDKVAQGSGAHDVLTDFLLWTGDAVLVAHHAPFDLAMLNPIAVAACGAPIQNLVLDTVDLARRLARSEHERHDLDSLLDRYDIPEGGARHTALGDALLTARLLQKLLKSLAGRGVETLAELAMSGPGVPPTG